MARDQCGNLSLKGVNISDYVRDEQARRNSTCLPSMEGCHGCDWLSLGEQIGAQLSRWMRPRRMKTEWSVVCDAVRHEREIPRLMKWH